MFFSCITVTYCERCKDPGPSSQQIVCIHPQRRKAKPTDIQSAFFLRFYLTCILIFPENRILNTINILFLPKNQKNQLSNIDFFDFQINWKIIGKRGPKSK